MANNKKTNITHLNNYSINKTLENIRHYKRKKFVRLRTGVILVCGIIFIGIAGLPLVNNTQKTTEINQLYAEASSELEALQEEKKQIEYRVNLLEDEEYIAKLARKELNLSKENEILINLPEEKPTQEEPELEENLTEEETEVE